MLNNIKNLSLTKKLVYKIVFFIFCLIPFFSGLVSIPPLDRDESRFVQSTYQMIETNDTNLTNILIDPDKEKSLLSIDENHNKKGFLKNVLFSHHQKLSFTKTLNYYINNNQQLLLDYLDQWIPVIKETPISNELKINWNIDLLNNIKQLKGFIKTKKFVYK